MCHEQKHARLVDTREGHIKIFPSDRFFCMDEGVAFQYLGNANFWSLFGETVIAPRSWQARSFDEMETMGQKVNM